MSTALTNRPFDAADLAAPPNLMVWRQRCLFLGIVGAVALVVGWVLEPEQFYRSYLLGFMWVLGVTLGCFALLMLQYVAMGMYGLIIRRITEAASRNLPLMAVLFVPLWFGMSSGKLYDWSSLPAGELHEWKFQHWLQPNLWTGRAVICFVLWIGLAAILNRWGARQDVEDENHERRRDRFRKLAAPGLVIYALTMTAASIDWIMSLDTGWFSTIYGLIFLDGQALSGLSFVIIMLVLLTRTQPMQQIVRPDYFHDIGKLTFAFILVWGYFNFSQFLIIWSGNLPEEIHWYLNRMDGGWQYVFLATWIFEFAVPFALLLSRTRKRASGRLVNVAILILFMRLVDLFFYIAPNFESLKRNLHVHWLDVVAPLALGSLWLAAFFRQLMARPLMPVHDGLWVTWKEQEGHDGH